MNVPISETRPLDLHIIGTFVKADFETLVIPIKRVNRLLLIEARVDTLVGNFILDTGAPGLVLNNTYFRNYWTSSDFVAANAANTAFGQVRNTWVNEFELKELRIEQIKARLTELGHIENRSNTRILGLLGVSILKSFVVTLDLHKNVLILQRPDKKGNVKYSLSDIHEKPVLNRTPIRLANNTILMTGSIAGKKLLFCLDTGAEAHVLSSTLSTRVLSTISIVKRSVLLGTGGSQIEVLAGTLQKITLGSSTYFNMNTIVSNLDGLGEAYGETIHGMIGYDFLTKGIVNINFVKKELCIYPFDKSNDE